jgi:hypothetical protein
VKDILNQPDPQGKRGKLIAALLEYDVEINPTKLIKGQGISQMMIESNFELLGVNCIVDLSQDTKEKAPPQISQKNWIHLGLVKSFMFYKICRPPLNFQKIKPYFLSKKQ